ncbi:MAG TPA: hypothetical protein VER96_26375 [Polyangiaceae bacterium]|nr:hypothetical protein [Polyangiaceae bacterium]
MAFPPPTVGATTPAFAWTGSKLIVWGGIGLDTETSSCAPCGGGGIYDPKTDSWRALSSVGAPRARSWNAAVWTGTDFLTWGGLFFPPQVSAADQVGAMYNPEKDAWQKVSTAGQPAWRAHHVLAWTGREALVWGGANAENVRLCDGGRFDPAQNVWRSISLEGAAQGCIGSASVWTGEELLVWGGSNAGSASPELTSTGAAYNPDTDSWRPISNVGAPPLRSNPATVWTGQEMIVYSGNTEADVRAYDPASDHWRSLSAHGAPGFHAAGDAVWTGSEMLVWGAPDCEVGGRYDLASDTWKPFSSKGALRARSRQTLVWTGEALLIYGGAVGVDRTNDTTSGALYAP